MLSLNEFINEAIENNAILNDENDLWISIDYHHYLIKTADVLGRQERYPFEASYEMEENKDHPAWEKLYELYKEELK